MKFYKLFILFTIFLTTTGNAFDLEEAKEMYTEDCTKCHDSKVFTRKDRKVKNLLALKKQVHSCVANTGASWFEEDEENVVNYLSETFYKFDK